MAKTTAKTTAATFSLVNSFPGYNSSGDKTRLAPGFLIRGSKNVVKKITGTIASRDGIKRRGSVDSADAGVVSSFEWEMSVGRSRYLRVCNNKLQVESDIITDGTYVWYDLLITSTLTSPAATLTRFVFDTWWDDDEKSDRCVMVRGDDKILHWSGGIAAVLSATASTITKRGSTTWAEEGFATILGSSSGVITGVDISAAGSGYTLGDLLTVTGGGGTGGVIRAAAVSGGAITAVEVRDGGSGYSVGTGLSTTGGTGTGFQASISTIGSIAGEKKIIIDGREFTYTGGEDTTTLTGVTASSGTVDSLTDGMVAIQSIIVGDDVPINNFKADFCKTIQNQLWVGSYSSRIVYVSADVTVGSTLGFLNFVNNNALLTGDPDAVILDSLGKGIGVNNGKVIIFSGNNDMAVITPNYEFPTSQASEPITGGTSRFVTQKIEKKQLAGLTSALGHEFIGNLGEYLVWVDQNNRLRALGTFTNVDSIKPVTLSIPVQVELSEDDFTGGHLKVISDDNGDTLHITAPINGRDWMYQIRELITNTGEVVTERLWQPPQIRGISRFAVMDGILHGHSNANPQAYQINNTGQWYDDGPSEEEIPYACVARFAYQNHGQVYKYLNFDQIYWEGYMPEGVELKSNIYRDYQGSTVIQSVDINSNTKPAKFFINNNGDSLGDESIGGNPLGDGILPESNEQESIPKFRKISYIGQKDCYEYSIEVYSQNPNSRWELLTFGTSVKQAAALNNFISS